jgi:hypothetical protein
VTEQEWLNCTDPQPMLEFLRGKTSERKLRLFACVCCRRIWNLLHDKRSRKAVECSEQFADGQIDKEQLSAARKEAEDAWWRRAFRHRGSLPDKGRRVQYASEAVKFVASATGRATELFEKMRLAASASLGAELLEQGASSSQPKLQRCDLLRELFGNPFRPSSPLSAAVLAWNGGTVVKLAQSIYDDRAFDRLPILADALEEAGCTDQDILQHCRLPGVHVRGCWPVDLILVKE